MDKTNELIGDQKRLHDLINHDGWALARQKLVDKIMDLQNAFNIEDSTAESLLIDLKSRKMSSRILYEWLQDVEGTAQQFEENSKLVTRQSYLVIEE